MANPVSANPTIWSNTQTFRRLLPKNCLIVFDHFVGLRLKGYGYFRGVFRTLLYIYNDHHCVKSDRIRRYSGLHFPAFGLNTEKYSVSLCIQTECGKIRTRITPNTDNFYPLHISMIEIYLLKQLTAKIRHLIFQKTSIGDF